MPTGIGILHGSDGFDGVSVPLSVALVLSSGVFNASNFFLESFCGFSGSTGFILRGRNLKEIIIIIKTSSLSYLLI